MSCAADGALISGRERTSAQDRRRVHRVTLALEPLEPRWLLASAADWKAPLESARGVLERLTYSARMAPVDIAQFTPNPPVGERKGFQDSEAATPPGELLPPYQIVVDDPVPHATLATAERLPNISFLGIAGTLRPNEPTDVFAISIDPRTLSLQFTLKSDLPDSSNTPQLRLFDSLGRPLVDGSLGTGPLGTTLSFGGIDRLPGSVLYLEIVLPGTLDPSSVAPMGYQVWVLRHTTSEVSAETSAGPLEASLPTAPLPLYPAPVRPDSIPPLAVENGRPGESATTASAAVAIAPRVVAAGPLPTLTAAPSGGVLDERGPDQPIDQLVVAESGLDHPAEPAAREGDSGPRDVVESAEPGPVDDRTALVTWNGPGGYPLLGAAPTGDWRGARAVASGREALGATALDPQPSEASAPAIDDAGTSAVALPSPEPPRRRPPAPIRTGRSMAVALAVGFLFADPAAVFHSVVSLRGPAASRSPGASRRDEGALRSR
jgi:hypothetical protein